MGRQGKRKRLARGIYEDKTGRSAVVQVGHRRKEKRFPPATPMQELRDWQDKQRVKFAGSGSSQSARGTLNAAIDSWERLERYLASWRERRAELRAWGRELGTMRRGAITDTHVRTVIGRWSEKGISGKTIRNRLWTLRHLYRLLDGPDAETPCDHVQPPPKTRTIPTLVSIETVLTVYRNLLEMELTGTLHNAKTRARFMVRAATGRRPCEIARTQPEDLDFDQRTWRVRDAKGGWSEGLYLNDDMLAAWVVFAEAKAWGAFNTGSFAEVLRSAGWPKGVRPYNLRHSLGIALSESGIDLADVSGWLGHSRVQTTRNFYVPILHSRMERAAKQIDGRFSGWKIASNGDPEVVK